MVRDFASGLQPILIMEWFWLEPPIFFERELTRADFATTEIEQACAAIGRPGHKLPIHKVIGPEVACAWGAAAVIGEDFVAKEKAEHR